MTRPRSHFEALPVEILTHIFILAASSHLCPNTSRKNAMATNVPDCVRQAISMSHIDSRTRQVAITSSRLWVYLYEGMPALSVKTFLERSGTAVLTVRIWEANIDLDVVKDIHTLSMLIECGDRWGVFFVKPDRGHIHFLHFEMPILSELYASGPPRILQREVAGWKMPAISTLHWHGPVPNLPFPSTLTILHYYHKSFYNRELMEDHGQTLLSSLTKLPCLRHLSISSRLIKRDSPAVQIGKRVGDVVLENLESLQIRMDDGVINPFCTVPLKIVAPRLCRLALNVDDQVYANRLLRHFNHGGIFDLVRIAFNPVDGKEHLRFPPLYANLPRLQNLTLSGVFMDEKDSLQRPFDISPHSIDTIVLENSRVECGFLRNLLLKMHAWDSWGAFKGLKFVDSHICCWDKSEREVRKLTEGKFHSENLILHANESTDVQDTLYWEYML